MWDLDVGARFVKNAVGSIDIGYRLEVERSIELLALLFIGCHFCLAFVCAV
jgi:hypothetical protein